MENPVKYIKEMQTFTTHSQRENRRGTKRFITNQPLISVYRVSSSTGKKLWANEEKRFQQIGTGCAILWNLRNRHTKKKGNVGKLSSKSKPKSEKTAENSLRKMKLNYCGSEELKAIEKVRGPKTKRNILVWLIVVLDNKFENCKRIVVIKMKTCQTCDSYKSLFFTICNIKILILIMIIRTIVLLLCL